MDKKKVYKQFFLSTANTGSRAKFQLLVDSALVLAQSGHRVKTPVSVMDA